MRPLVDTQTRCEVMAAPFDEPSRQKSLLSVGPGHGILRLETVKPLRCLGLSAEVAELGHGGLHAECHFILVDASLRFGVLILRELQAIQRCDIVE